MAGTQDPSLSIKAVKVKATATADALVPTTGGIEALNLHPDHHMQDDVITSATPAATNPIIHHLFPPDNIFYLIFEDQSEDYVLINEPSYDFLNKSIINKITSI